ncbi:MAG: hypothetical protein SO360_01800 [Bifidobacterium tsurumiense]|uniref:hypothetical protein n=1 Tax=Bifidobacterium tsurumiense TaxID=356829 RepID=UPI002A7F9DC6|nr:hypothetical protein [Bifidobacterium tsurumiense]MDY4677586.1 hypothetical protein [Bifidobacterium tsurumiense]
MLAHDAELLENLRTARALGISYKRWLGWVPSESDSVEWDETERTWMLALSMFENSRKCPLCGLDTEFCHDEDRVHAAFAGGQVEMCFVSQLREQAMRKYADSGVVQDPNSVTTRLLAREE